MHNYLSKAPQWLDQFALPVQLNVNGLSKVGTRQGLIFTLFYGSVVISYFCFNLAKVCE